MMFTDTLLVIGLGNPILGDDGVGWRVVEVVQEKFNRSNKSSRREIEFDFLSLGGLSLMERMNGYRNVVIVDSIITGKQPVGNIYSLPLEALPNLSAGHTTAAHDASLVSALQLGRKMGFDLPDEVWVVAIEVEQVLDFSEELSPTVAAAVSIAANTLIKVIDKNLEEKTCDIT